MDCCVRDCCPVEECCFGQKASTGLQLWSGVDSAVRVALVVCFLLSLPDLYWLYPLIGHLWMIFVANLLLYVGVKDKNSCLLGTWMALCAVDIVWQIAMSGFLVHNVANAGRVLARGSRDMVCGTSVFNSTHRIYVSSLHDTDCSPLPAAAITLQILALTAGFVLACANFYWIIEVGKYRSEDLPDSEAPADVADSRLLESAMRKRNMWRREIRAQPTRQPWVGP